MRFESVRAHPFGPFRDETLALAPGLNVVYGPNEAGKSSWHAALYAGLCGMRRGKGAGTAADRRFQHRHRPWDADAGWAVSAVVALADGRRVELRRDLASKVNSSASDADLAGRDYAGEIMYEGAPDGSRWLGLNRRTFLSAACVRQAQLLGLPEDAGTLQQDLQRAAATAGADQTAASALERLTTYRREEVGSGQAPTRPLRKARARVERCESDLREARSAHAGYLDGQRRVEQLDREVRSAERRSAALEAALAGQEARNAEQRAARAATLTARFPDGPPHRTAADDHLSQQVSGALATWRARPDPRPPSGPTVEELERELARTAAAPPAVPEPEPAPASSAAAPAHPAFAPYLGAAAIAAGIALAAGDYLLPGLVAGGLGLGLLAWWLLARRAAPSAAAPAPPPESSRDAPAERQRLLLQQIDIRRAADRRYREDVGRSEQAAAKVREAAALATLPDGAPDAQVAALADWRERRRRALAEDELRSAEWNALQQALAGQTLAEVEAEAVRRREHAAQLARQVEQVDPEALATAQKEASAARLAEAEEGVRRARAECHTARGQVEQMAADLPGVPDAEDALTDARRKLERIERLDRTLAATIDFLEQAEDRVHRDIAPVLRSTVIEWLPRVTGGRYTDCKVDPETLQVEVRGGGGRWRKAGLLSHGTAEQVYLLLRLAITRHLAAPGEICPLLLDDVVAACDTDRKAVVLDTLHAVSGSTQVILFTHEDDVRAWARQRLSAPRDRLTELPPAGAA